MNHIVRRGLLLLPLPFAALPLIAVVVGGGGSQQVALSTPAAALNTTGFELGQTKPGDTSVLIVHAGKRTFHLHVQG